jgi:hypothetical protein
MTPCTACFKPIEANALFCTHCGAAEKAGPPSVSAPSQSQTNTKQTHLFQSTSAKFKVRWTYWAWAAVALVCNLMGGYGYLVGCVVTPYLIVSAVIARRQWEQQKLLDAKNASPKTAVPANVASATHVTSTPAK